MKNAVGKQHRIRAVNGVRDSGFPAGDLPPPPPPAEWNLPATINIPQSGTLGLRQYAVNAGSHTISVSGLPAGVTYNAGTESLVGASTGTGSATATFTLSLSGQPNVQDTATVGLVAQAIDNVWTHGEIVTLTPDQFGLETFGPDPNMRLFDTQDNQTVYNGAGNGENVPYGPGYVYQSGTTNRPMQFETGAANARHAHDTKRYRFDGRGFLGRPYAMDLNHTHGRKMFLECWIRYEVAQTATGACKVFRIWGDTNGDNRYSSWTNNPYYLMGVGGFNSALRNRTDWMRLTAELDTSSPDVLQWRGRYWVDGQLWIDHFRPPEQSGGTQWPQLTWGPPVLTLIGHDPRTPESTFGDEWRWGRLTDVYLGIGPERIAITDSATYGPTQNHELQEIVSWSPSAVQIRVFEGALGGLEGKYVHFVGSGNVAQGTALEIPSGYDLTAAIAAVPFTVNMPAEPVITADPPEAICTTVSEINASLAVNGRRTIIAPGVYSFGGHVSIGGSDKHILFQPGASFTKGFSFSNASRIKLEGAVFSEPSGGNALIISNSQDMTFERITMSNTDYGLEISGATARVLFLSSSLTWVYASVTGDIEDFIIANSEFVSTTPEGTANGWAMRWYGDNTSRRNVMIDSRFAAFQNTCVRFESTQVDGYFARNQIEGNSAWRAGYITNFWFLENDLHDTGGPGVGVNIFGYPGTSNVNVIGNRAYAEETGDNLGFGAPTDGTGTVGPDWTLTDNLLVYTPRATLPPAWEMQ